MKFRKYSKEFKWMSQYLYLTGEIVIYLPGPISPLREEV